MKKIIIALLCAFTLFAFASCSGDTPAPDTGTGSAEPGSTPSARAIPPRATSSRPTTSSSTPARMLRGSA